MKKSLTAEVLRKFLLNYDLPADSIIYFSHIQSDGGITSSNGLISLSLKRNLASLVVADIIKMLGKTNAEKQTILLGATVILASPEIDPNNAQKIPKNK